MKTNLNAEIARQILDYDPETGLLRWRRNELRAKEWNTRWAGQITGSLDKGTGALKVRLNDEIYVAHRLAWLVHTGSWPAEEIDHINGNRADNRWVNLRAASRFQNMCNRGRQSNNQSGFLGVRFRAHHKKWEARITVNRKLVWRAYANTAEEADVLRREALPRYHGEFIRAHDQPPA